MSAPIHHLDDDLLRAHAVGAASEGAGLVVCCHASLCPTCQATLDTHQAVMNGLLGASSAAPSASLRARLLDHLPPRGPAGPSRLSRARLSRPLPSDLPALPAALTHHLASLDDPAWHALLPGLRAIDLKIGSAWRARLVRFRPGIPIPMHDHEGPEHTVVFSGGLDDEAGHLGRGDATTRLPGQPHRQRASAGEPCVALIVNEAPPRPLTLVGRVLKRITNS